jgi:hypothetical protein
MSFISYGAYFRSVYDGFIKKAGDWCRKNGVDRVPRP